MKIELKDINDDLILQRGDRSVRVFNQLKDVEESDYWVDMGLPSGTLWAKANIDVETPSGFQEVNGAISPYTYMCSYFSWGNTDGHNPTNDVFSYDFGTSNDGVYANTAGAGLTDSIPMSQDAARVNCGAPWRIPSLQDITELFNNCDFVQADGETVISGTNKLITLNSVLGVLFKSRNNENTLFLPACGVAQGTGFYSNMKKDEAAVISTASIHSTSNCKIMEFTASVATANAHTNKFRGFPIRPVL